MSRPQIQRLTPCADGEAAGVNAGEESVEFLMCGLSRKIETLDFSKWRPV